MNDKEYLDQIWGELPVTLKKYVIHCTDVLADIKYKIKQAKQLPDTADHKAERIERLNLLLNYLRGE